MTKTTAKPQKQQQQHQWYFGNFLKQGPGSKYQKNSDGKPMSADTLVESGPIIIKPREINAIYVRNQKYVSPAFEIPYDLEPSSG